MNFVITRAEIVALTGVCRTETFALQKAGKLLPFSCADGKKWFNLFQVLNCISEHRNLPPPDESSFEMYARLTIEMRLKKSAKPSAKATKAC